MSGVRAHRILLSLLCLLTIASCRTASETTPSETPATDTVVATTPPFKTKEPERYSVIRTITTTTANGETVVTTTLIARDGPMRREDSPETRLAYLDLPEGRFVLSTEQKTYSVATREDRSGSAEAEETSPNLLLHTDPISTTYQALGAVTIGARSTQKYRIVVNSSARENVTPTETLMWIDDQLNMPIKSETRSPNGTRTVMELSNLLLDVDKQLFQIPPDYKKVVFTSH
jgi:outer membrane lipoprotein-sorting protein